jgi:hypothetical protein
MTIDERLAELVKRQEWSDEMHRKTQVVLADLANKMAQVSDDIRRLERVAGVLLINDEELDRRLTELENRPKRKPS